MEQGAPKSGVFSRSIVRIVLTVVIGIGLIISILGIKKILSGAQKIDLLPLSLSFVSAILSYLLLGFALNRPLFKKAKAVRTGPLPEQP